MLFVELSEHRDGIFRAGRQLTIDLALELLARQIPVCEGSKGLQELGHAVVVVESRWPLAYDTPRDIAAIAMRPAILLYGQACLALLTSSGDALRLEIKR